MRTIRRRGLGPRGLYFGVGLAFGLALAAHGAAASSVNTPCRSGGTTKPPVVVARPAPRAAVLTSGQQRWQLTLTGVAVTSVLRGTDETSKARGKYVVVFMTAQNVGTKPQDLFTDEDFAVLGAQGRQFGRANATVLTDAEQQYKRDDSIDQVQPTFNARVVFVFDVATDARGFTLVNVPLLSDTAQKLFTLGI